MFWFECFICFNLFTWALKNICDCTVRLDGFSHFTLWFSLMSGNARHKKQSGTVIPKKRRWSVLFPVWATRTSEKIGLPNLVNWLVQNRKYRKVLKNLYCTLSIHKNSYQTAGSVSNALLLRSTWFSHILAPYESYESKIVISSVSRVESVHCLLEELTWHPTWSDFSRTWPTHGGSSGSRIEMWGTHPWIFLGGEASITNLWGYMEWTRFNSAECHTATMRRWKACKIILLTQPFAKKHVEGKWQMESRTIYH